jgi:hypothetical protein
MDINDIDSQEWAAAQRACGVLSKLPARAWGEQIHDAMAALGLGRTAVSGRNLFTTSHIHS